MYLLVPILIIVSYVFIAVMCIKTDRLYMRDKLSKDSKVRYVENNSGYVSAQVKVYGVYRNLNIGGNSLEDAKERISNRIIDNEREKYNSKVKNVYY